LALVGLAFGGKAEEFQKQARAEYSKGAKRQEILLFAWELDQLKEELLVWKSRKKFLAQNKISK